MKSGRAGEEEAEASTPWVFAMGERRFRVPATFQHPGGEHWMERYAGKDIRHLFEGGHEDGGVEVAHRHSASARRFLERFEVEQASTSSAADDEGERPRPRGRVEVVNGVAIDFDKPLVFQVGKLEDNYQEWVHRPELGKPRFFESEICEQLSKTNWWVVPLVWIPVAAYLSLLSHRRCREDGGGSEAMMSMCFVFGVFFWSLVEYSVHRFMFHVMTSTYWWNTFHFLFHGCHHKFPMDDMRLVMPPAGALPIVLMVYAVESAMFGPLLAPVTLAGTLSGYMAYDLLHYHCHFSEFTNKVEWLRRIRSSHMDHHYRDSTTGFGISSPTWDVLMNTHHKKTRE